MRKPMLASLLRACPAGVRFNEDLVHFGFTNGTVNVTLAPARHLVKDGASVTDAVAVAHLRCNIPAAIELRAALDSALLLAAKAEGAAH